MLGTTDDELTVDNLAARAGVTVRTVRFYSSRGLLPPPRLRGRVGLYGADHLARLELIRDLQTLGFTLSAIERHLRRVPAGATPEDLALRRALLAPWTDDQCEDLDRHELDRRAGARLDDDRLAQLRALGIVERVDGHRVRLRRPAMLSVGLQILDLGLPLEMLVRAKDIVEQHTTEVAVELHELFTANVLRPFRERGSPEDERERVRATTDRLRTLTVQVLVNGFQRAVNDVIRDHVRESDRALSPESHPHTPPQ
jgi:DNA-binding transcriptional MerR regulator